VVQHALATTIREHNRSRVLAAFAGAVALTRTEIAARTGLSRTTVTGIVSALLAEGLLHVPHSEHVVARTEAPGRPPELLARTPARGFGVALDIGHERLQGAVADLGGRILARGMRHIGVEKDARSTSAVARALVADLVQRAGVGQQRCAGIVAGIPEPIGRDGMVGRANIASRWQGHRPGALLGEALGRSVHAENDANLAVLGETVFGVGRGVEDAIYVKISHGVGLGMVINGRLVRGTDGLAGEIGHTQVRPDGVICRCGNRGCLYTLAASEYLAAALHAVTRDPHLTIDHLATMGRQGDPGAGRVLRDAGREVGRALANLCNTLNPRLVVVGGSLARAGDWATTGLRTAMEEHTEARVAQALDVVASRLGERAELYGALAMAIGFVDPRTGAAPEQREQLAG